MAAYDDVDRTICLTGPECTGKTTLALELAERLGAALVPEVARDYLAARGRSSSRYGRSYGRNYVRNYGREDLLEITRRQLAAEREARAAHRGLLLCDTDLLVLRIWWREKYGPLPPLLEGSLPATAPRGYLLLAPDIAWEPDPQRENPIDRQRLFALHLAELAVLPHRIVEGQRQARSDCALEQLQQLIGELGELVT